ncbi:MAG: hypothetical protein ACRC0X_01300 [Brevinema sp.]
MKSMITILLMLSFCSVVSPEVFLNQVQGKKTYNDPALTKYIGEFSSDGRSFEFLEGNLPIDFERATSDRSAIYAERKTGIVTHYTFTVSGNTLGVEVDNGQPPFTLYLN